MIKPLAAQFFVLGLMATGAFASPIFYNITFNATSGTAPTAGSFTYDSAAPLGSQFAGFTVVWGGGIYDLTSVANTGEQLVGTDCGTTPSSQSVFSFLSGVNVCGSSAVIAWDGSSTAIDTFDFRDQELSGSPAPEAIISTNASTPYASVPAASGSFTISSVPEPSTFTLALLSGALFWGALFRRRAIERI